MPDCCGSSCAVDALRQRQSTTLKWVLGINLVMFLVELTAGLMAGSTALLADSLDMLGDTLAYGFSLYVVARSDRWKAVSAVFKGAIMAGFGLFVLAQAVHQALTPALPHAPTIGAIGLLALAANAVCLALLTRHRSDDVNMRSVWLCSRNDIIANLAVLVAAVAVWGSASRWPDLIVGVGIALLFLSSALRVLRDARSTWQAAA